MNETCPINFISFYEYKLLLKSNPFAPSQSLPCLKSNHGPNTMNYFCLFLKFIIHKIIRHTLLHVWLLSSL